jgi:integrase
LSTPYRTCSCRAPATTGLDGRKKPGKLLGKACPRLKSDSRHGKWYAKYEAPPKDGRRVQRRVGPCDTEKAAKEALVETLGQVRDRTYASDRNMRVGDYLDRWLSWQTDLKPRTMESYSEAFELYWKPAIGHMRLADLAESDIRDTHREMRKLNRPAEAGDRSEKLRRLAGARATVPHLPGVRVRNAPLSETRIKRVTAPLVTALNHCKALPVNPAKGTTGKARKIRPLLWTAPRVERWRRTGQRPSPVMVWSATQTGAFLDSIAEDRLYPLYHLACYWGLRRGELHRLEWSDVDLAARKLHVRVDVKSEDSDRNLTIDPQTANVLRTWQEKQLFEALEWDTGWQDSGRVFTGEHGAPLRAGHISEHLEILIGRVGLPPVRFHDLRHGAASMLVAAGQPIKVVSEILGHATSAFTADVYVTVAEELNEAAAAAISAYIPRRVINESSQRR